MTTSREADAAASQLKLLKLTMQMRLPPIAFICRRDRAEAPEIARFHAIVRLACRRSPPSLQPAGRYSTTILRSVAIRFHCAKSDLMRDA